MSRGTVVVTRPEGDEFAESLQAQGFKTIVIPLFSLQPRELQQDDKKLLSELKSYSWLVFTSQYGVRYAHQLLADSHPINSIPINSIPINQLVAVIGKKTAQVFADYFKRNADFIGAGESSEQFAEQFVEQLHPAARIMLFTAFEHRGVFTKIAGEHDFVVDELAIYQQAPLAITQEQIKLIKSEHKEPLLWPFFSPSAVRSCLRLGTDIWSLINAGKIFSIGPVTTAALKQAGIGPVCEPKIHTEQGMLELLCAVSEV